MNTTLTPTDIKHKKRTQARVSQTTGALGLASLGAFGAATIPGSKRAVKAIPALKRINPAKREKFKTASLGAGAAGSGIGGVGSFNFASYTRAEADKGTKVKKNVSPFEDGYYSEIVKAYDPESHSDYDPEKKRSKRADNYKTGLAVGSGVAAAGAAHQGVKAGKKIKDYKNPVNPKTTTVGRVDALKTIKTTGRAAGLAAVAGGALYGRSKIDSKKKGSWSPYVAKSMESAFGITHD